MPTVNDGGRPGERAWQVQGRARHVLARISRRAGRRLYLDPMIRDLAGVGAETDLTGVDLEAAARRYLSEGGLTDGEIDGIVAYLCN